MIIGEVVETLIYIKDSPTLSDREREAVIEACNLLDKLPRLAEAPSTSRERETDNAFSVIFGEKNNGNLPEISE